MVRNPKISIIVPVYKVEKFLSECVSSILTQSFRDFEDVYKRQRYKTVNVYDLCTEEIQKFLKVSTL